MVLRSRSLGPASRSGPDTSPHLVHREGIIRHSEFTGRLLGGCLASVV